MSAYIVTIVDGQRRRHRYTAIAHNWFEAWKSAADVFGIARLIMVRPK